LPDDGGLPVLASVHVKVLREFLRLRKRGKDERDEQESSLDLSLSRRWRRRAEAASARPEASFRSLKKLVFTAFQRAI
jgi:hypothetical protein